MNALRLVLFIALKQLWARKLLNGIAVCGVALGVLVLIGMNGIMQGFQMRFKGEILRISPHITVFDTELGRAGGPLERAARSAPIAAEVLHERPSERRTRIKRPDELVHAIEAMPEIEAACKSLVGQAILSLGPVDVGADLRGVEPERQERCTPVARYAVAGTWRALDGTADGIVLGAGLAEDLGAHVGDRLRVTSPGSSPTMLKVVAILDTGVPPVDHVRAYVNLTTAQAVLRRPDEIGRLELRLRDPSLARALGDRLEALTGYDAESWQEANANFLEIFRTQTLIVRMVIGAILTVGGFGILAIQIMIVLQKTRDIAILRAVGLRRADVLCVFLIQGALVALAGAVLGDVLGWRLVEFLSRVRIHTEGLIKSTTFLVYKSRTIYGHGILFALFVGLAASLLPALRASRVEPVDVLRGQIG